MVKRLFIIFLSSIFIENIALAATIEWETWDNSVIRLLTKKGETGSSGTAFAINQNGDYVTNHHVIEDALNGGTLVAIESVEPHLKTHPAQIIWHDAKRDLAVVRINTWRNPPLAISTAQPLIKDMPVVTIGFPGGSDVTQSSAAFIEPKLKRGVISAVLPLPMYDPATPLSIIEHDAVVNSGNSGGPLSDNCGRIVGINSAKANTRVDSQDLAQGRINLTEGTFFSINSRELIPLLKAQNIAFIEETSHCEATATSPSATTAPLLNILSAITLLMLIAMIYIYFQLKRLLPTGAGIREVSRLVISRVRGEPVTPPRHPIRDPETGKVLDRDTNTPTARLIPLSPELPILFLTVGSQTIGRANSNKANHLIPNEYISSQHIRITLATDGTATVQDLKSANGTRLNNQPLEPQKTYPLQHGQTLNLGGIHYRFMQGDKA